LFDLFFFFHWCYKQLSGIDVHSNVTLLYSVHRWDACVRIAANRWLTVLKMRSAERRWTVSTLAGRLDRLDRHYIRPI
jgi:hypothetical protein